MIITTKKQLLEFLPTAQALLFDLDGTLAEEPVRTRAAEHLPVHDAFRIPLLAVGNHLALEEGAVPNDLNRLGPGDIAEPSIDVTRDASITSS